MTGRRQRLFGYGTRWSLDLTYNVIDATRYRLEV